MFNNLSFGAYITDILSRQKNKASNQSCIWHESLIINPIRHDVGKQEKCSSLEPPRDNFYKTQ